MGFDKQTSFIFQKQCCNECIVHYPKDNSDGIIYNLSNFSLQIDWICRFSVVVPKYSEGG